MPYAVWIDMSGPEAVEGDEVANAQLPELILELIEAGWEVTAPVTDDEDATDTDEDSAPELLDVRVLGYPTGAFVGLAVDTDSIEVAMAFGASLGRHLRDAAPALMGWTVDSLRVDHVQGPNDEGDWLPPLRDDPRPRFPVAEHLSGELQELCAQYLIAGAVLHLLDPTLRAPRAIDATDVVAGAVAEHPWGREFSSALGGLLIAAGRVEAELGVRSSLASRGEGDPAVAQALVDSVRHEIDTPSTGYDDDDAGMRGHVVLEQFMEQHDLRWNWVNSDLDGQAAERRSKTQLRALLWAGLRALATMTTALQDEARSAWMWLTALDDNPVVEFFADQDDEEIEISDQDAQRQIAAAARAHLLMRAALLHPEVLEPSAPEFDRLGLGDVVAAGDPLHHLVGDAVLNLGAAAVEAVLGGVPPDDVAEVAEALLPVVRAVENEEDDALDDLYRALEDLLPSQANPTMDPVDSTRRVLLFLAHVAHATGTDQVKQTTRFLLRNPAELACVIVDENGRDTDAAIRRFLVALSCGVAVEIAGKVAAELPELAGDDPRDEPALRHEVTTWWARVVSASEDPEFAQTIVDAVAVCSEPGAGLLRALVRGESDRVVLLAALSTGELTVGVAQALSALSVTAEDPELPQEFILEGCSNRW